MRVFRLGSRKSALATTQSKQIQSLLQQQGVKCEIVFIESAGDADQSTPLYQIESREPGLFTKQLEKALLSHHIDLAVHSLKDLPTEQPPELIVGCLPAREDPRDCLLFLGENEVLEQPLHLPRGAVVGTSSLRREAQLLSCRPDLQIVPLRGNVPTRVEAVRAGKVSAVVLAEAGLFRLGLSLKDLVKMSLPVETFVPAPGQGALAVEVRRDRPESLAQALAQFHDVSTEMEVRIERRILRELEGGCTLPLGVRCQKDRQSGTMRLFAFLGIAKATKSGVRQWQDFPRFDIQSASEESVVAKTVEYFRAHQN